MTISDPAKSEQRSLTEDLLAAGRYYLGSRTGLIAIAAIGLGAGAYFNWGWLVAAGLAPILLVVAPCGVMCALGLCMNGRSKVAGADQSAQGNTGTPSDTSRSLHLVSSNDEGDSTSLGTGKKSTSSRDHKGCC